jgi:hypothetical protein
METYIGYLQNLNFVLSLILLIVSSGLKYTIGCLFQLTYQNFCLIGKIDLFQQWMIFKTNEVFRKGAFGKFVYFNLEYTFPFLLVLKFDLLIA